MSKQTARMLVIARSAKISDWLKACIGNQTAIRTSSLTTTRHWHNAAQQQLRDQSNGRMRPMLLLKYDNAMKAAPVQLCETVLQAKGCALIYHRTTESDDWLMFETLKQKGVIISSNLEVLINTAQAFSLWQQTSFSRITRDPSAKALLPELPSDFLKRTGSSANLSAIDGKIILQCNRQKVSLAPEPQSVMQALSILADMARDHNATHSGEIDINRDILEAIARPPRRLLSETASKTLLSAFGFSFAREELCSSPNQATTAARDIGFPVVMKLVRPELTGKMRADAVRTNVKNKAAVTRSYQHLINIGKQLGPPAPLGILVCETSHAQERFWLQMHDEKSLGRLVVLGSGSLAGQRPLLALKTPATLGEIHRRINTVLPQAVASTQEQLSETVYRFSVAVDTLGPKIDIAEIHPLAIDNASICLDALVGITNSTSQ